MNNVKLQRTWLKIKQFAIEANQQKLEAIENELEVKTMLVDTMQQGSVDARQQKQFLEGVVHQADGVIGEMGGTLEQKEGYIGKVNETLDEEKRRLRVWAKSHGFTMLHIGGASDEQPLYHVIRCKNEDMDKAIKKVKSAFPTATIFFQKHHVPNPINMYNRLKSSGIVKFKRNKCISRVSEAKLIQMLNQVFNIVKPEQAICIKK